MRHIVPIKVVEYLAAGKPVLATPLPGLVAEFGHASGIRFVDDPTRFWAEAQRLLTTVGPEKLRQDALDTVAGHDWSAIVDRFEEVLQEAASGSAAELQPST
jgi:glycosyltransferase involved in cell wall biosynthesis